MRRAFAPGRVNLIGEHTDYTGGFVLPIAVHLGTTVELSDAWGQRDAPPVEHPIGVGRGTSAEVKPASGMAGRLSGDAPMPRSGGSARRGGEARDQVVLSSADEAEPARVHLDVVDVTSVEPTWARYVAGVVAELSPNSGGRGHVTTTLPIGAGLSSSAALEVAVALALGFEGTPLELALLCQRAEQRASGVPCGIMDQLASAAGVAGHALLIDCSTNEVLPVPLPEGVDVVAVHSGERRSLAGSAYAERRSACERAAAIVGPLRAVTLAELAAVDDPEVRRRARHVVTENARTLAFVDALRCRDLVTAGQLMDESHASLCDDFEVSTPALDALVERLRATPGVYGARLTGAGFGGCAVALCEPGALTEGWRLDAVDGASVSNNPRVGWA